MNPYIVAELGASHGGSLERACALVDAAAKAGADAIKLQTWTPGTMCLNGYELQSGPWAGRGLADLYREAHTPWEWHAELFDRAKSLGMDAFSSVFDLNALDFLEELDCPMYKIASFELVDLPLIEAVARTGKPIILSTGMATQWEIGEALDAAKGADVTLLHCCSAYPAPLAGLYGITRLKQLYDCGIGLSDHTLGTTAAVVAVALGADIIEKHLTVARTNRLDDCFASEPEEFAAMVTACREASQSLGGDGVDAEEPQRTLRRSLYWNRAIEAGAEITPADITTARPALGLAPRLLPEVVGRSTRHPVQKGEPVTWACLR